MAPKTPAEVEHMKQVPYRQLVGALMYLAVATRPDIAYAVGVLGRFSSNPGPSHWKAAKHLCRYLQGTKDYRLTYAPDPKSPGMFTTFCVKSNNPKGLSESSSEHNCCLFIDIKTYLSPAVSTTVKGVHTAGLLHL